MSTGEVPNPAVSGKDISDHAAPSQWIAIGTASGWDDITKFGAELQETSKWRLDAQTTIISTIGGNGRFVGDGRPATSALLYNPSGLTFDAAGNLFIADTNQQVQ